MLYKVKVINTNLIKPHTIYGNINHLCCEVYKTVCAFLDFTVCNQCHAVLQILTSLINQFIWGDSFMLYLIFSQ